MVLGPFKGCSGFEEGFMRGSRILGVLVQGLGFRL